jgi:dTMP kinase
MEKNNYTGKFIVIEGLDGSGQSTQVKLLNAFLVQKGYQVITTKEPTQESISGKKIKEVLDKSLEIDALELQELFAQDRKEHLERKIIPNLKQNKVVISDRYYFSTFAYGAAHGADLNELIKMNENFLLPDLTFLLKVKPETCINRIEKRGNPKTLFEKREQLAKVWDIYKILPERFKNIYIIDAEQSIENVFGQIKRLLLKTL